MLYQYRNPIIPPDLLHGKDEVAWEKKFKLQFLFIHSCGIIIALCSVSEQDSLEVHVSTWSFAAMFCKAPLYTSSIGVKNQVTFFCWNHN